MKLDNRLWLSAIVLAGTLLTTGCAELPWNRESSSADTPATPAMDIPSFRATSSSRKSDSILFNEKSHEIERSLGL